MTGFAHKSGFILLAMAISLIWSSESRAQAGHADCIRGGIDLSENDRPAANSLADLPDGQLKPLAASYFLDPAGNIGADSITSEDFTFTPCQEQFDIARAPGALWLKFTARNPHADEKMWGISLMETVMDDVTLFQAQGDTLVQIARDGRTIPAAQSDNDRLQTSVSFRIEPGQEETYYVRVSGTYAPSVTPVIGSVNLLSNWSSGFTAISAVMLGFCIIMTLFSLILFRHIHPRFYQFYTAYLIGMFFMTFLFDGWPHVLFGSTVSTQQWKPFIELASGLVMIANIQYCRILLTIDTDPQQRKQAVFHWLTGLGVIGTIWAMIDPLDWGTPVSILLIINPFVLLYVSGRKMLDGVKQAVPVFASLFALSIGLFASLYFFKFPVRITETSSAFDLIMMRPITLSYTSSTIVEAIFMMVAISIMITAMQRQRNAAVTEAIKLRDEIDVSQQQDEPAQPNADDAGDTLNALLASGLDKKLLQPAGQGFLDRATQSVIDNVKQKGFGAQTLASELGITEKTLGRRLKKSQGLAPAAFIRSIRLSYARDLILLRQFETVAEIADASGFSSVSHFAKLYRQEFKETPGEAFKSLKAMV
ncbi:helix-turn-helix domain-containing protein [Sphingorhabdus sp. Alg231-15]|uniref:helix-turn-helix domain-containing protein n=1 Tax=Sphingorhabdus sp. Alg231-15 TaxID=1922222 RepID=UPI00307CBAB2